MSERLAKLVPMNYDYENGVIDGEKSAVEGIADWLRSVNLLAGKVAPAELAERIERGKWRPER